MIRHLAAHLVGVVQAMSYAVTPALLGLSLAPRRFQAYCVGTGRSGTKSVANMFRRRYRVAHEPDAENVIDLAGAAAAGTLECADLASRVRDRDRRLRLELESSNLAVHFLGALVAEFPEARFILTIRDCYSWLDSTIGHQMSRPEPRPEWTRHRKLKFGTDVAPHAAEERALAARGVFTVDGYLAAWGHHNRTVLGTVPAERLLVVRTGDLVRDAGRIADFLGVPTRTLDLTHAHAGRAQARHRLVEELDDAFLDARVRTHCGDLMDRFYPELPSAAAWRRTRLTRAAG